MYVVKVHPHRAILEGDYFVKMIEIAEAKRDEEIRKTEAGIDDEEYPEQPRTKLPGDEPELSEWEKI